MKTIKMIMCVCVVLSFSGLTIGKDGVYPIVDTGQIRCYNNSTEIEYPRMGRSFFGQDANYSGLQPSYEDNGDGTVTDLNTGLMWQKNPGSKKSFAQAVKGASKCRLGGYTDWRLPTIKELYSLILFSGTDPDPRSGSSSSQKPYIDNEYFDFKYGDESSGDRIIDSQYATSTKYVSKTMDGNETMFGVNFADGRIKGYPSGNTRRGQTKKFYVMYVRENTDYGKNYFQDNGDGTVTDNATGLTWMQVDSGHLKAGKGGKMNWKQAIKWAENLKFAGHSDWRLPNAKELQSIVDYTRSPDTTNSAAIDPIFKVTSIKNEGGKKDYPYYWTGTTHASKSRANNAVYISFGRALGYMRTRRSSGKKLMDVHGAGAQRSDSKTGRATSRGPQGDIVRVYNFVRCVRGGTAEISISGPEVEMTRSYSRRGGDEDRGPMRGEEDSRGSESAGQRFVDRLDKNGDGKVSKSEFDGPSSHFKRFDKNNDGYISESEAPTGPPPQRGSSRGSQSRGNRRRPR